MISLPAASALLMELPHLNRPVAQGIISSPLDRALVSYFIISGELLLEMFTQPGPSSEGSLQSSSHVGPKHLLLSDISISEWCDVET